MARDLSQRLHDCYSGAVHDVLRERGVTNFVLPQSIRPVEPAMKAAGPAFTMEGRLVPGVGAHETLLAWTEFLSKAPRGSVVVCQPNDSTIAHMGELSSETLQLRGVRGYIVDGGCRDTQFICRIGFPVFCRYTTPIDVVGRWLPTSLGEPVTLGDVKVHPGDYVLADRDGAVVIPAAIAEEVIAASEKVMNTESHVRKAILEGMDPREAYLKFGKF